MSITIRFPASVDPELDLSEMSDELKSAGVTTAILTLEFPRNICIEFAAIESNQVFRTVAEWGFE